MGKRLCVVLIAVSVVFTQSGCSMLRGSHQNLGVTTNVPDAKIYVNGELVGSGNVTTSVPSNRSVSVMAQKEGYYPASKDIGTKMSSSGVLDIVGGCIFLIPFVGLFFAGSRELQKSNVSLILNSNK